MVHSNKTISKNVFTAAKKELKKIPGSKTVIKLKAIMLTGQYPVKQVAAFFEVSPRTIFRWVNKFAAEGVEGLIEKPKGHLTGKISDKHGKEIERWIASEKNSEGKKTSWTLEKLRIELEEVYDLKISNTAIWNHLKKKNLSIKK